MVQLTRQITKLQNAQILYPTVHNNILYTARARAHTHLAIVTGFIALELVKYALCKTVFISPVDRLLFGTEMAFCIFVTIV